jgi:hypothetical protein
VPPVAMPELEVSDDAFELDRSIGSLIEKRQRWDWLVGHFALLMTMHGLWRDLHFISFDHYCRERLGGSGSALSQRARLQRTLWEEPGLREALESGRIGYEKARLLTKLAPWGIDTEQLEYASKHTVLQVRDAVEREHRRQMSGEDSDAQPQMCAGADDGGWRQRVPEEVADTVRSALSAARKAAAAENAPPQTIDELFVRINAHYRMVMKGRVRLPSRKRREVLERDPAGRCQVPGCSNRAVQVHHIVFRRHGGKDEPSSLVGLCMPHHQMCLHVGYMNIRGQAPHSLTFELGVRDGKALQIWRTDGDETWLVSESDEAASTSHEEVMALVG